MAIVSLRRLVLVWLVAWSAVSCGLPVTIKPPDGYTEAAPGQIIFGTDLQPSGHWPYVKDRYTSVAPSGDGTVAFAAAFSKPVTGVFDMTVSKEGVPTHKPQFTVTGSIPFFTGKYKLSALPVGHYVFTMTQGSETLATGELDVRPS
jgi:hypothetical protein